MGTVKMKNLMKTRTYNDDLPAFGCGGAAAPNRPFGEGCLSGASSLAILFGAEAEEPAGPRTGGNGFGSFCRNKRTSSRGGETPQIVKYKRPDSHYRENAYFLLANLPPLP